MWDRHVLTPLDQPIEVFTSVDEGRPLVTLIVTCMNHSKFVASALESVRGQNYGSLELIVTDDGSSDGSQQIIRDWLAGCSLPHATVMNAVNKGLCRTLNSALELANGDLIAVMSADDWMEPNRVERQVEVFERSEPKVGVVYSDMHYVDQDGRRLGRTYHAGVADQPRGKVFEVMLRRGFATTPSVMMRREYLVLAGPYDEDLPFEDYDMFLRLAALCEYEYIPEPLVNYRINPASLSGRLDFRTYDRHILEKHLGRTTAGDHEIAGRIGRSACALYEDGRSAAETRDDLRLVVRYQKKSAKTLVYLLLSSAHVPGTAVASALRFPRRVRARRQSTVVS